MSTALPDESLSCQVDDPVRGDPGQYPQAPLPRFLTPLVGREREIAPVALLVRQTDAPLVTLVGPGGVGKTRLAVRVAEAAADAFPDGVAFVSIAAIHDPELVLPAVAEALLVRETGDQSFVARLTTFLRPRQMLLVLDNLEQVLAAAPAIAELLAACPSLTILATSRAPLRVSGERTFDVAPLALPDEPGESGADVPLADLAEADAVRLFVARAQAVRADFALTAANAAAVATICRRLDGLPLAIELAAARVRALPLASLQSRLSRRLPLLTAGARDAPRRLQTMRDAIAWSFDLLDHDDQIVFCRLAVFPGSFTLDAAEAVAAASPLPALPLAPSVSPFPPNLPDSSSSETLDRIASLVDKSLVRQEELPDGDARYLLLETIREFGWERLTASGEAAAVSDRHAAWCLALAERAAPELLGPEQRRWAERLDREHPNLRAALAWLIERGDPDAALRLAGSLTIFWFLRGHLREGAHWLELALAQSHRATPQEQAWSRFAAGLLHWARGDIPRAEAHARAALDWSRQQGLIFGEALAWYLRFLTATHQERRDGALDFGEQAVARMREAGNQRWLAYILGDVGGELTRLGDTARGEAMIAEGLALHRERGNKQGIGNKLGDLGLASHDAGDETAAVRHYADSIRLLWEGGDTWYLASPVAGIAAIASRAGLASHAGWLLGAAMVLRERSGSPGWPQEQTRFQQTVVATQARLGAEEFARLLATGRAMPLATVVAEATALAESLLRETPPVRQPTPGEAAGLSPREYDVLHLLASGKSNPEIADALFIGRGTVRTHVSNILAKLEARTRTEAAAIARDRGLL